ncbi:MAG: sigma-70 family RNA polymerase sigma factor [Mangrovibacterium sp.]|nr:sigma-70 family RNA polymerase sigma factor [Mangrovibacterium sp.]
MKTELSRDTFEKSRETDLYSIKKLNSGDPKALRFFFDDFYPSVCVFAIKFIKQSDVAEDLAQDAFVQFWKIRDRFTSIRKIRVFIYTTVRNACINYLKQKRTREDILAHNPIIEELSYELLVEEETYRLLDAAIQQLPNRTREIILLALQGHNNPEIAEILGVSINTIKTLKKNAYIDLRHMLSNQTYLLFILSQFLS